MLTRREARTFLRVLPFRLFTFGLRVMASHPLLLCGDFGTSAFLKNGIAPSGTSVQRNGHGLYEVAGKQVSRSSCASASRSGANSRSFVRYVCTRSLSRVS